MEVPSMSFSQFHPYKIWINLDKSGTFWINLDKSGTFWINLDNYNTSVQCQFKSSPFLKRELRSQNYAHKVVIL